MVCEKTALSIRPIFGQLVEWFSDNSYICCNKSNHKVKRKKGNILIVDDNEEILWSLNQLLKSEFEKIFTLKNPNQVLFFNQFKSHHKELVFSCQFCAYQSFNHLYWPRINIGTSFSRSSFGVLPSAKPLLHPPSYLLPILIVLAVSRRRRVKQPDTPAVDWW